MTEWLNLFVLIIVPILLIYSFYKPIARRREIRSTWQAIAEEMGWIFFAENSGNVVATLQGTKNERSFEVKAYLTTGRNGPVEYAELIASLATPKEFSLLSRFSGQIVGDDAGAWRKLFDRVKSGDILFDNSYSFAGYPKEDVKRVLANAEIRLAIKAIYPLNAPIFVHPIVHLADGQIGIRLPKPLTQKSEIRGYVEKLDKLAELIEKEFGVNN